MVQDSPHQLSINMVKIDVKSCGYFLENKKAKVRQGLRKSLHEEFQSSKSFTIIKKRHLKKIISLTLDLDTTLPDKLQINLAQNLARQIILTTLDIDPWPGRRIDRIK